MWLTLVYIISLYSKLASNKLMQWLRSGYGLIIIRHPKTIPPTSLTPSYYCLSVSLKGTLCRICHLVFVNTHHSKLVVDLAREWMTRASNVSGSKAFNQESKMFHSGCMLSAPPFVKQTHRPAALYKSMTQRQWAEQRRQRERRWCNLVATLRILASYLVLWGRGWGVCR